MDGLTMGELAKQAGVNRETIRYYERRGLLASPGRTVSGYRKFPAEAVTVVRFIKRAQWLGFTLKEVKDLLLLNSDEDSTCADIKEIAMKKSREINEKVRQLKSMQGALKQIINACPGAGSLKDCSIIESLTERRIRS